jgi:phosphoserine phosphatase
MTVDAFTAEAKKWMEEAKDGRWKRPYTELTYQPMQEVLSYLRANGFKTYIVTGGSQDFVRVYSQRVYGIPPSRWWAPSSARPTATTATASRS